MAVAIKVENLAKAYQLGEIGTGTLSRDLERWFAKVRGKEDPFLKIGETNDRTSKGGSDVVWSLKDVNFEINQGDAVGIIGRNGAGKSTLLKLLSRVTSPSLGTIKVKGRIASLLEVGTGFHPELTGKENIYLNGAILGMRKREIARKFDEIVAFAGVERYIDTPVKRYSSGMYVRLAFAVAAHLESEILIVDEVLAVGDAEFQSKCLGKMNDVSKGEGRTVLFVSHNMGSIKTLCDKGILLKNGQVQLTGDITQVVNTYISTDKEIQEGIREKKNDRGYFTEWLLSNSLIDNYSNYSRETFDLTFKFTLLKDMSKIHLGLILRDDKGDIIYGCNSRDAQNQYLNLVAGEYEFTFHVRLPIKEGSYEVDIALANEHDMIDHWVSAKKLKVIDSSDSILDNRWTGILVEKPEFSVSLQSKLAV